MVVEFDGESYRDLNAVEATGDFRPGHLLDARLAYAREGGLPPDGPRKLGREVRLGVGRGDVAQCLQILRDAGFAGPLVIENYVSRASGTDPVDELQTAKAFIEKTLGDM